MEFVLAAATMNPCRSHAPPYLSRLNDNPAAEPAQGSVQTQGSRSSRTIDADARLEPRSLQRSIQIGPTRSQDRFIDATRSAHIRLLLVSVPRLLIDAIAALAARREIDVVGEVAPGESVLEALARTYADVVVVELDDSRLSPPVRRYLDTASSVRVVTLRGDATRGAYYDVHPTPIEGLSGETLLAAVEGRL